MALRPDAEADSLGHYSYDDLEHYQAVMAALARTVEIQTEVDVVIGEAGGWPLR